MKKKYYWPTSRYFLDADARDDEIHFATATRVYKDHRDIRGRLFSLVTSGAIWNVNMQNIFQSAPNTIKFKTISSRATINIQLGTLFMRSTKFLIFPGFLVTCHLIYWTQENILNWKKLFKLYHLWLHFTR